MRFWSLKMADINLFWVFFFLFIGDDPYIAVVCQHFPLQTFSFGYCIQLSAAF